MHLQANGPQRRAIPASQDQISELLGEALVSAIRRAARLVRWATPRLILPAAGLYLIWLALPYLLLLGVLLVLVSRHRRDSRRRRRGIGVAELVIALVAANYGLRRQGRGFGPSWHPCEQCGHPIDKPSRARYCSEACRRYARLRRAAAAPELEEVPF
jgi:hypothetical protein